MGPKRLAIRDSLATRRPREDVKRGGLAVHVAGDAAFLQHPVQAPAQARRHCIALALGPAGGDPSRQALPAAAPRGAALKVP